MGMKTMTDFFKPVKPVFDTFPASCLALLRMLKQTLKRKEFYTLPYGFGTLLCTVPRRFVQDLVLCL
jgi:hypothetical protein